MADKTRLHIISLVTDQERSVEEIAALLGLKPPSVSHHLNKLKECGLVSMRPDGTVHFYRLNEDRLSTFLRDLSPTVLREVSEDLDTTGFDRKVLQTFIVSGKLIEIPAHSAKNAKLSCGDLVKEFAFDRQYTEREVNEVLKRFHEDASTLRREFIATKLMARENNVY